MGHEMKTADPDPEIGEAVGALLGKAADYGRKPPGAEHPTLVEVHDAKRALLSLIASRVARAREEGRKAGIDEALREVNAMKQRNALARDRAAAAGRDGVAMCRQSDVETCEQIETALRSLASSPGAPDPRDAATAKVIGAARAWRHAMAGSKSERAARGMKELARALMRASRDLDALSAASSTSATPPSTSEVP